MFLDERGFEGECFGFIIGDDEFDIGDLSYQLFSLDAVTEFARAAGLKIRTHTIAQVLGLADIDDFAALVLVKIDSRRARNFFKFFVERHSWFILSLVRQSG